MVNGALSLGGFVGVLLSGAFVYWEIGRYAAPQVPQSLFDERKELFAYTAGLFVGVPIAFVFLLLNSAIMNGAGIGAIADVLILVAGIELAQWLLRRSVYFGRTDATPFYALGFRAGVGGILVLAAIAAYLGGPTLAWDGLALVAVESLALIAIQVNGALVSLPRPSEATGGIVSGFGVSLAAMAVLAFGLSIGGFAGIAAGLLILGGLVPSYRRLRRRILGAVRAHPSAAPVEGDTRQRPFGRTGP
ncbi:MAG: hypothetical protein L3J73_00280 [Thermoplasmata archaeon]|nr:hypothetical protein [Thermoplasmata archaeon]